MCPTGELYVSDRQGSDDTGDSTKEKTLMDNSAGDIYYSHFFNG